MLLPGDANTLRLSSSTFRLLSPTLSAPLLPLAPKHTLSSMSFTSAILGTMHQAKNTVDQSKWQAKIVMRIPTLAHQLYTRAARCCYDILFEKACKFHAQPRL